MSETFSTGSPVVDRMLFFGSPETYMLIPDSWNRHLLKDDDKGKGYPLALMVLSKIVYAYRPRPIRNESGQITGYGKYFAGDLYQISYGALADSLCQSKTSVRSAVQFLEEKGLVTRVFRSIEVNGTRLSNVMYLELNVEALIAITDFSERAEESAAQTVRPSAGDSSSEAGTGHIAESPEKTHPVLGHLTIRPSGEKPMPVPSKKEGGVEKKIHTDTNKVLNNLLYNLSVSSKVQVQARPDEKNEGLYSTYPEETEMDSTAYVLDQICTKDLILDRPAEKREIQELSDLILDVVNRPQKNLRVNGCPIAYEVLRERFLKLDRSMIESVLFGLDKSTRPIAPGAMRNYLITCLYNATFQSAHFFKNMAASAV